MGGEVEEEQDGVIYSIADKWVGGCSNKSHRGRRGPNG